MNFSKEFENRKHKYVGTVLNHIHYKKLHTRISKELSDHIEDMYLDYSEYCDDETEIIEKIFNEMGDPNVLGEELKRANSSVLFHTKVIKCVIALIIVVAIALAIIILPPLFELGVGDGSIETAEARIVAQYTNGTPIKLITEFEHNNTVHLFYVTEAQENNDFDCFLVSSIELYGYSVKNLFDVDFPYGWPSDCCMVFTLDAIYTDKQYDLFVVYYGEPIEKYIRLYFETDNSQSELKPYWSDYIEIPQDATIDNPKYFILDCPDGYHWNNYERFDENKNPIDNYDFIGSELR